jgi:mono/diheme cytochrome c family protein
LSAGAKLYETHCADCHGLQGQGRVNAYPALAGNRAVLLDNANNLIHSVLNGGFAAATAGNSRPFGMPPFLLQLSDGEIAAVLTYVRNAWGNQAGALTEFDINKLRRSQAP